MSLADKKNSLFGKAAPATAASTAVAGSTPSNPPISLNTKPSTTSSSSSTGTKSFVPPKISNEAKQKKVKEARELSEKATKYLKTSVFQWNPDNLAAAPLYEQSAEAYKAAEQYDTARLMYKKAAECHEGYGSLASAAMAHVKAAKIASQQESNVRQAAKHYEAAATYWGTNGDLDRCADYLTKAAKELEDGYLAEAIGLYIRACDLLCPSDTTKENLSKTSPHTLETFRSYFRCLVLQKGPDESLIPVATRMIDIFEAYGTESSMCKMMLTVTLIELYMGDVVRAENTFLNVHLNNASYARSKECELADLYVMAFKRQDITKLDEALQHPQINYLDKEIQPLAKKLSLFRTKQGYVTDEEAAYNQAAENLSKDMSELMKNASMTHHDHAADGDAISGVVENPSHVETGEVNEFADDDGGGDGPGIEDEIDLS